MPKYYVQSSRDYGIVSLPGDPVDAVVKAIRMSKINTILINGYYAVSQTGFDLINKTDKTVFIPSDDVLERLK